MTKLNALGRKRLAVFLGIKQLGLFKGRVEQIMQSAALTEKPSNKKKSFAHVPGLCQAQGTGLLAQKFSGFSDIEIKYADTQC